MERAGLEQSRPTLGMFALHSSARASWSAEKVQKVLRSLWETLHESAETSLWRESPVKYAPPALRRVCAQNCCSEPRVAPDDCVIRVLKGSVLKLLKQLHEGGYWPQFQEVILGPQHSNWLRQYISPLKVQQFSRRLIK